ncbi:MAG: dipicolinate synthase subunit B [Oscillospiraceae bacterium]|jgi:dipicolinate synthase subunit B|nr:dipicolinate synthase subunit B [Oscillospiraceae bacterium]
MTDLTGVRLGFAVCGSFCNAARALEAAQECVRAGAELLPIVSESFAGTRTRFGAPEVFLEPLSALGGGRLIRSVPDAEPIGPKNLTDILAVVPCTGNLLGKLANGITDGTVPMAVKSHLRGGKPVVLCISTNDGLAASARNLGDLLNRRHYYFVPFGQDAPVQKPTSLSADFSRLPETVAAALEGRQLQPLLL